MSLPLKSALRKSCLERRLSVALEDHKAWSAAISEKLADFILPLVPESGIVAGYSAVKGEVDVTIALILLAVQKHITALPWIVSGDKALRFSRVEAGDELMEDMYGIPAPKDRRYVTPDLLIVPMLAFDASGHRLGYGAGYYDVTLATLRAERPVLAIGAAFSLQQVEALPAEAFDQRLDAVVTEKGIIRF